MGSTASSTATNRPQQNSWTVTTRAELTAPSSKHQRGNSTVKRGNTNTVWRSSTNQHSTTCERGGDATQQLAHQCNAPSWHHNFTDLITLPITQFTWYGLECCLIPSLCGCFCSFFTYVYPLLCPCLNYLYLHLIIHDLLMFTYNSVRGLMGICYTHSLLSLTWLWLLCSTVDFYLGLLLTVLLGLFTWNCYSNLSAVPHIYNAHLITLHSHLHNHEKNFK